MKSTTTSALSGQQNKEITQQHVLTRPTIPETGGFGHFQTQFYFKLLFMPMILRTTFYLERHVFPKCDISRNRQVVELQYVGDAFKTCQVLLNLKTEHSKGGNLGLFL